MVLLDWLVKHFSAACRGQGSQALAQVALLEDAEKKAIEFYSAELSAHLAFTTLVHNLIAAAIAALPPMTADEVPQQIKVLIALLIRLANDLRTVQLLARTGYPLQALSIVAGMYEVSHTILLVAANPAAAAEWAGHRVYTQAWKGPRELACEALTAYGSPETFDSDRDVYTQLCMAKHANTLLQVSHGIEHDSAGVRQYMGPDRCRQAICSAWFALQHAGNLGRRAVAAFLKFHGPLLPDRVRPYFLAQLQIANAQPAKLTAAARLRFPDGVKPGELL